MSTIIIITPPPPPDREEEERALPEGIECGGMVFPGHGLRSLRAARNYLDDLIRREAPQADEE